MKLTPSQVQLLRHIRDVPKRVGSQADLLPGAPQSWRPPAMLESFPSTPRTCSRITDQGQRAPINWEEDEGAYITSA
jgi:hypothetical protein